MIFFGDPETKGDRATTRPVFAMAWSIAARLLSVNAKWRAAGIEHPVQGPVGINSGYCKRRPIWTLGRRGVLRTSARGNLAARRAVDRRKPDGIVTAMKTFAMASDATRRSAAADHDEQASSREVIPYRWTTFRTQAGNRRGLASELKGLDF